MLPEEVVAALFVAGVSTAEIAGRFGVGQRRIQQVVRPLQPAQLPVPDDETLGKDSRFNIPAVILKLQDTRLQGKIVGHVIRTLYDAGFIGDEAYVMQLKDLAAEQEESNDDN